MTGGDLNTKATGKNLNAFQGMQKHMISAGEKYEVCFIHDLSIFFGL